MVSYTGVAHRVARAITATMIRRRLSDVCHNEWVH